MQPNKAEYKLIAPITAQMDLSYDQKTSPNKIQTTANNKSSTFNTVFLINHENLIMQYNKNPAIDDCVNEYCVIDAKFRGDYSEYIYNCFSGLQHALSYPKIERFKQEIVHTLSQQGMPRLQLLVYKQK